jgi:hypothetical protein
LRWQETLKQTAPGSKRTITRSKQLSDYFFGRRNLAKIFYASF